MRYPWMSLVIVMFIIIIAGLKGCFAYEPDCSAQAECQAGDLLKMLPQYPRRPLWPAIHPHN